MKNYRQVGGTGASYLASLGSGKSQVVEGSETNLAGIDWNLQQHQFVSGYTWQDVVYGNNLFVAVGTSGTSSTIITSPDGTNWTFRTAPNIIGYQGICFGKGLFVIITPDNTTSGKFLTSPDGINWTVRTVPTNDVTWWKISYGNNIFVAIGQTGTNTERIMTSYDGINWTLRSTTLNGRMCRDIVYGNGRFVIVLASGSQRIATSTDGISWTLITSPSEVSQWYSVTYGNDRFVAVSFAGTTNRAMYSLDGLTWIMSTTPISIGFQTVEFGNNLFVAIGDSAHNFMTSPDGINWTHREFKEPDSYWRCMAFGRGRFVALGVFGNRVIMDSIVTGDIGDYLEIVSRGIDSMVKSINDAGDLTATRGDSFQRLANKISTL